MTHALNVNTTENQSSQHRKQQHAPRIEILPSPTPESVPHLPDVPGPSLDSRSLRTPNTGPLGDEGWQEFTRIKWGLEPKSFRIGTDEDRAASLSAVYYVDKRGRVQHPRRNSYMPIAFMPTPTDYASRKSNQWLELASGLVAELRDRGVVNTVTLPPSVTDVRPWTWAGFQVGIRYTYMLDFPLDLSLASKELRRKLRKSAKADLRIARTMDMSEVTYCLASSQERQGFDLGLTTKDLELARNLMGDDVFRAYAIYAADGEPASAAILLHRPGSMAIGWVAGTRTNHLQSGGNQLMDLFTCEDLHTDGATGVDLCGANIPGVAASKAPWGARLVPYYSIEAYSAKRLAKWSLNWWKFTRRRTQGA